MQVHTSQEYYGSHKAELLKEFDGVAKRIRSVLVAHYGEGLADAITCATRQAYEALIPQLPYIGGKQNPLTWNLVGSAWFLALYKVLKTRAESTETIRQITYESFAAWYNAYPRWLVSLLGLWKFTPYAFKRLQRRALASQQRRYPGDWVFTALKGDGQDFDWGVDYTECGMVKFYHAQGADEFMPQLCPLDFLMSERFGFGLARTMTLAEGGARCDFRFKRGRATRLPSKYYNNVNLNFNDWTVHWRVIGLTLSVATAMLLLVQRRSSAEK